MVMDFVDSFGCLCMIKKTEEQFYIAKPVAKLAIPYNIDQLGGLEQTLGALFQMRSFLIDQSRHIHQAMIKQEAVNALLSLELPSLPVTSASTTPAPYIFWETKRKNEPANK
ncbi:hypothetical protein G6F43_010596 [Rhizopus delemar]|nr:hypothetical protein G6F43_010596 [Rhizopus delemar]